MKTIPGSRKVTHRILAMILSLLMLLQCTGLAEELAPDAATVVEAEASVSTETEAAPAEKSEPEPVVDYSDSTTMRDAGMADPPVYFEGTLVFEGADYTVTAVIGADAMFPEDVQMRVEEIMPGTELYQYYAELTDTALSEDWDEVGEFARFFDIAFVAVVDGQETEIEPQAYIDVQIIFQEVIAVDEETDVQAVHFADETPQMLSTETDSNEAAVTMDDAVDTVSFSSDTFSVYGVFQKVRKTMKVITASGETFTMDVSYSQDAEIPDNAELIATEIPPTDPNYDTYRTQAALALGSDDVRMPGLFDIGIYVDGEKIEPAVPVNVKIGLQEGIEEGETLYVVHFPEGIEGATESQGEEGTETKGEPVNAAEPETRNETKSGTEPETAAEPVTEPATEPAVATEVSTASVEGETVTFEASGFSVYALAYTVEVYYKSYTGETFRITLNYDAESGIPGGSVLSVTELMPGTERYEEYLLKTAETLGKNAEDISSAHFFDIEITKNGEKIEPTKPVEVTISYADPLEIGEEELLQVVHFGENGTEVITDIALSADNTEMVYYQNSFSVTGTVVAANGAARNNRYGVLVEYNGQYYAVEIDGSLKPAVYNASTNTATMQYPLMWDYEGYNGGYYLRVRADGKDFNGPGGIATTFYNRYLCVNENSGISTEVSDYPDLRNWCTFVFDGNYIHGIWWPDHYLGVECDENGIPVKLAGNKSRNDAVAIKLVRVDESSVPVAQASKHTVNHLDISIHGSADLEYILPRGTYYYKQNNNVVEAFTVTKENPKTLTLHSAVPITKEDIKRATITAKDVNGNVLNNAFYITGYSGNQGDGDPNMPTQIRIEGSFKVASNVTTAYPNISGTENEYFRDHPNNWTFGKIREQRLASQITYTVTTTVMVDFELKDGNRTLCDVNGNPIVVQAPVTLSGSCAFWDSKNICPGTDWNGPNGPGTWNGKSAWQKGIIPGDESDGAASGIDFELGGSTQSSNPDYPSVRITKYIVNEDGEIIPTTTQFANSFTIWQYDNPSSLSQVISWLFGLDYHNEATVNVPVLNGMGTNNYELDVTGALVYIEEDKNSIPREIEVNGVPWRYVKTSIETEKYYFNNNHSSGDMTLNGNTHYNSVPELAGKYDRFIGKDYNNPVLDFYVYNVYEVQPRSITVRKVWKQDGNEIAWPDGIATVTAGLFIGDTAVQKNGSNYTVTFGKNTAEADRTFTDLPVYDESGNEITYTVRELYVTTAGNPARNVQVQDGVLTLETGSGPQCWKVENGPVTGHNATITNTAAKVVFVEKNWTDAYGNPVNELGGNVTVQLYRVQPGEMIEEREIVPGERTAFILPVNDDANAEYYVVETAHNYGSDFDTYFETIYYYQNVGQAERSKTEHSNTANECRVRAGGTLYIDNALKRSGEQVVFHKKWIVFGSINGDFNNGEFYFGQLDGEDMNAHARYQNSMQLDVQFECDIIDVKTGEKYEEGKIAARAYDRTAVPHTDETNLIRVWFPTTAHPAEYIVLTNMITPDAAPLRLYFVCGSADWKWGFLENSGTGQAGIGYDGRLPKYGYYRKTDGTVALVRYTYYFREIYIYDGSNHTKDGVTYSWTNPEDVTGAWWKINNKPAGVESLIENRPLGMPVVKVWKGMNEDGSLRSEVMTMDELYEFPSVGVTLYARVEMNGQKYTWEADRLVLNRNSGYSGTFHNLERTVYNKTVTLLDGTQAVVTGNVEYGLTEDISGWTYANRFYLTTDPVTLEPTGHLENIVTPKGSIRIRKVWKNDQNQGARGVLLKLFCITQNGQSGFEVTGELAQNPEAYGLTDAQFVSIGNTKYIYVSQNASGQWSLDISGLHSRYVTNADGKQTEPCMYYIEEVGYVDASGTAQVLPDSWTVEYSGERTSDKYINNVKYYVATPKKEAAQIQTLIVTNTPEVGSLQITKTVLVKNAAPTTDNAALTNGTYEFTINGIADTDTAGITRKVYITFESGHAVSYRIDNEETVTITPAPQTNAYSVVVPDMTPGDYTISETAPTNGMVLKEATGGKSVTNNVVTVTVTGNDKTPNEAAAKASFTNNYILTDIHILKVKNGTTTTEVLTGAVFRLDQEQTVTTPGEGDEEPTSELKYVPIQNNIAVDQNGHADILNLTDGKYQLVEIQAPAGYVMLSGPISFTVSSGEVTYNTQNNPATVTYRSEDQTFVVGNEPGVELPSTGGPGTLAYTIAGLALVLTAGVLLLSRKRRQTR